MINHLSFFISLAVSSLFVLILVNIGLGFYFSKTAGKDLVLISKLTMYAKVLAFILFLLMGFSMIPPVIAFFSWAVSDVLQLKNSTGWIGQYSDALIVGIWTIYLIGIVLALPVIKKSGFFAPELPDQFKQPPSL